MEKNVNYDNMVLLIKVVDDLLQLNDALINLTRMGYHERFAELDNVYEVIKSMSVFKDCIEDESIERFYGIVEELSESAEVRAAMLMEGSLSMK